MKYRLWIPRWRPARLNSFVGCRGKMIRLKKADREMVAGYFRLSAIPKATGKRRLSVTIVMGKGMRACDEDAFGKSLHDACKQCGAIRDDSPKWLEAPPVVQVRARKGEEWGTELILEDVE